MGLFDNLSGTVNGFINGSNNAIAGFVGGASDAWNNVTSGVRNAVTVPVAAFEGLRKSSNFLALLKKYWFIPAIVGGVIVGYTILEKSPAAMIPKAAAAALMSQYE